MEFCKIWGVGPKKAHDLAMAGYKYFCIISSYIINTYQINSRPSCTWLSFTDQAAACWLNEVIHSLTTGLRVEYRFEDLQERIPRQEMDEIKTFVIDAAESILPGIVENVSTIN